MRTAAGTRLRALLPALWAGMLIAIAAVATPVPFATLPVAQAGLVVRQVFRIEASLALALGLAVFLLERSAARRASQAGQGSVFSTEMVLALGTLFCTVAGYFALQPMMEAARAGQGPWSFGALHAVSTVFFGLKGLLVLALAWRASALRPPSS